MSEASNRETRERLLRLAGDLGDGHEIDWDRETADHAEARETLERLRILESVIAAHRALADPPSASPRTAPAPSSRPLLRWHGLEVGEKIGQTLYGEVFRATPPDRPEPVALVLRRADWPTGDLHDRAFAEEVQRLMGLESAPLHRVLGWGKDRGRLGLWSAMPEGSLLAEILVTRGRFTPVETAALGASLADALGALHRAGLVDRRIDPGRVLLLSDGAPRLLETARSIEIPPGEPVERFAPIDDPADPRFAEGRSLDLSRLARLLARVASGVEPPEQLDPGTWDLLPVPLRPILGARALSGDADAATLARALRQVAEAG